MAKTIFDLDLHEVLIIHGGPGEKESTAVTRVPGGWIYETSGSHVHEHGVSLAMSSVFVPLNPEFQKREPVVSSMMDPTVH
jgi:hypothetical protein